ASVQEIESCKVEDAHHSRNRPRALDGELPLDTGIRVVDEELEEVDHDHCDGSDDRAEPEEEPYKAEQEDRLVPVGDLDPAKRGAGELRCHTLDNLLVGMVGHRDIERGLPELDSQHVEETEEDARDEENDRGGRCRDIAYVKTLRCRVHANRGQDHHRLIGHDLEELTFRSYVAVGRICRICPEYEEDLGEREGEYHEQEVATGKEERARECHEDNVADRIEDLRLVHDCVLLLKELAHVPERLEDGRADTTLHAGRDLPVDTGNEATDGRCKEDKDKSPDKVDHRITPRKAVAMNMIPIRAEQSQTPMGRSRASPKYRV